MNPFMHYGPGMMWPFPVFGPVIALIIIVVVFWSLAWKGTALWYAARNHQRVWYIVLLIVNSLGILEIIYIAFFRKDNNNNTTKTVIHTTTTTTSTPTNPTAPAPTDSSGPVA